MMISASLLAADKQNLIQELKRVEDASIECIHFDVMDHIFVPNTSFMDDTFAQIRKYTHLPFEVHLMVEKPMEYIDNYPYDKNDVIIVHYECFENNEEIIQCLKAIKKNHRVGLSIKPNTKVEVLLPFLDILDYILIMSVEPGFGGQSFMESSLDKIEYLSKMKKDYHYVIEVDGGINASTGIRCVEKGCDILVSGSYLFKGNMKDNAEKLR